MLLFQEETNSFLKAIEEANKKMQAAEISLEEKDQRIGELDRLIERMEKVTDTTSVSCHEPRCRRTSAVPLQASLKVCSPRHRHLSAPAICEFKTGQNYKIKYEEVQESSHFSMVTILML